MVMRAGVFPDARERLAEPELDSPVMALSRPVAVIFAIAFVVAVAWASAATWIAVFRDDLVARVIDGQTEMQYAYEDRLGVMRAQMERVTSRQLLEQDSVDGRLSELLSRQAQLETRQSMVATLVDAVGPSATATVRRASAPAPTSAQPNSPFSLAPLGPKPAPLPEVRDPLREAAGDPKPGLRPQAQSPADRTIDEKLASADRSMRAVELAQLKTLEGMARAVDTSLAKLRSVVQDVGLDANVLVGPRTHDAMGGPFVPLKVDPKAGPFEGLVDHLQTTVVTARRLRRVVTALPLERPVNGASDLTSGFGVRQDPFTRGPAMHTGLDFKADAGTPVRATGPGRVVTAEYNGGYGNMVEVEHGNGITTRYAHLSSIVVEEGEAVGAGAVVGRIGSTGRSTGPHLHYETRVGGDAIDPQRFLQAGAKFRKS